MCVHAITLRIPVAEVSLGLGMNAPAPGIRAHTTPFSSLNGSTCRDPEERPLALSLNLESLLGAPSLQSHPIKRLKPEGCSGVRNR